MRRGAAAAAAAGDSALALYLSLSPHMLPLRGGLVGVK